MAATTATAAFDAQARTSDRRKGPGRVSATTAHCARRRPGPERWEEQDQDEALRRQKAPPPGKRPGVLKDPEPQGRIGQHCGVGFELVQALDVPVLQMVEQPVEVDTFFRLSLPAVVEQVIEVPKLALPVCAVQRAALSEPQLVEQLVEVPTVLSYSLLQQQTAEQIIDFLVPGRGGGARGSLQGLPQGQGSTASARGGRQGLSQGQGSTASAGKQTIVPARGGRQGFPQGQGSTASAGKQTIVPARGGRQGFPQGQGSTASAGKQTIGVARGGLHVYPRFVPGDEDVPPERFGTVLKASGEKGPGVIKAEDGGRLFRFQLPSWFFIPVGARVTFRAEEGLEVSAAYDVCFWG